MPKKASKHIFLNFADVIFGVSIFIYLFIFYFIYFLFYVFFSLYMLKSAKRISERSFTWQHIFESSLLARYLLTEPGRAA